MSATPVSIVIPVWNGREMLLRLLESLRRQTHPIREIVAVDNGSSDGAAEAAEAHGARVLRLGLNQGFSRAANKGIESCSAELIALVNSDVEPEPEWLARLVDALRTDDVWFATGKILSATERDRIDGTYDAIGRAGCAWRAGQGRLDGPEFGLACEIAMAPCTAVVFRKELFRRVGPFDGEFESYLEDIDLGLRCALRGLKGAYAPSAVAYHQGSASLGAWSPKMVRLVARNQVFLIAKYYSPSLLRRYWWPVLVGHALWGFLALRHGTALAYLQGKLAGLRRFRSMRPAAYPAGLAEILESGERQILEAQRRSGFDWYWRVYFLLTSVGRFDT